MQRFTRSDRPSIKDIRQTFSKRPVFFHCCELENGPQYVGLGKGFCHSKFTGFWSEFRQLNFWQAWMYQLSSWNQYKGWSFFLLFLYKETELLSKYQQSPNKNMAQNTSFIFTLLRTSIMLKSHVGETGEQAELNTPFIIKSANWITLLDES